LLKFQRGVEVRREFPIHIAADKEGIAQVLLKHLRDKNKSQKRTGNEKFGAGVYRY
jgi:hypothetical protein